MMRHPQAANRSIRIGVCLALAAVVFSSPVIRARGQVTEERQTAQLGSEITALQPGSWVDRDISEGQTHTYQITASANQYVGFTIQQRGIDVAERIYTSDGQLVAEFNTQMRPEGEETAEFVAETAGDYRLDVPA